MFLIGELDVIEKLLMFFAIRFDIIEICLMEQLGAASDLKSMKEQRCRSCLEMN